MKEYVLHSNRILNNNLVHAFCHEFYGSGKFNGCLKFEGICLTIRTQANIPDKFTFISRGREYILTKKSSSDIHLPTTNIISFSGYFSYAKKQSINGKNLALVGPNNLSNKEVCEHFSRELIGIKMSKMSINYIEPIFIKDTQIIHNVFSLQVEGDVVNLDKFEKAIKYGVGQKKSYGFGFINIL
jgi:hypothetical protein